MIHRVVVFISVGVLPGLSEQVLHLRVAEIRRETVPIERTELNKQVLGLFTTHQGYTAKV